MNIAEIDLGSLVLLIKISKRKISNPRLSTSWLEYRYLMKNYTIFITSKSLNGAEETFFPKKL